MKSFKNVNAYVFGKGIIKTDISFDQRIMGYKADGEIIDLPKDVIVVSGFIDEHIHGAGGADAMDKSEEALLTVANTLVQEGTTSFLATTMTQSKENIVNALKAVSCYRKEKRTGAEIIGVHLEGPFISEKHKGAQPLEYIVKPDVKTFEEYNLASGNCIKEITVAPETEGAKEFINCISKKGVVVSIGHTDAKYKDVLDAINEGAKCITHTFNAQSGLHHRDVGTVGGAFLEDGLYTEVIADTIHVSVPALKLLVKNKPQDKVILITDSMRAKGLKDGESELGGQKVIVKNGEARLMDGTLAGSVLKMNVAIKNMVEKVGVPFTSAIDFATINPARNLGIEKDYGSIEIGKKANFAVLDKEFNVVMTLIDGNVVYKK